LAMQGEEREEATRSRAGIGKRGRGKREVPVPKGAKKKA